MVKPTLHWFLKHNDWIYLKCTSPRNRHGVYFDFTTCHIENMKFKRQETFIGDLPSFGIVKKMVIGDDY